VIRLALLLVALALAAPAAAASFTLNAQQQEQALAVGRRSITSETFEGEWRIGGGTGTGESVVVITPFYRLVLAARHAAFKNEPVKPGDREKMLSELKDRLLFWVHLRGKSEDFARYYTPRLVIEDREIEPAFVQNERTSLRQGGGAFLARSVYAFPNKGLTPTSRVVLVVRDPDGALVTRFDIDLAKMR
jgi:hypothetical protein